MNYKLKLISALSVLFSMSSNLYANETTQLFVSATVSATCSISANNFDFGDISRSAISGNKRPQVSSSINVLCTKSSQYSINITYQYAKYGLACPAMIASKIENQNMYLYYAIYRSSGGEITGAGSLFGSNTEIVNQQGTGTIQTIPLIAIANPSINMFSGVNGGVCGTSIPNTFAYGVPNLPPDSYSGTATLNISY